MAGLGLIVGGLPVIVASTASGAGEYDAGHYIVVLDDAPLATNPATAAPQGGKIDVSSPGAVTYADRLVTEQDALLDAVDADATYHYTTALNGFAAELTGDQAAELARTPGVRSISLSQVRQLEEDIADVESATPTPDTDISPDLLGLRGPGGIWEQLGGPGQAGAGTVIGVVDSGLEYTNPSFAADGIPAPPATFTGECETGENWPADACSNKVAGARWFVEGPNANGATLIPEESESPRDSADGHGTHVTGTAAGRPVTLSGPEGDVNIAGMAPAAHIAVYKACWVTVDPGQTGCYDVDTIAAIDAATADGVDALNFSISGDTQSYDSPVDLAMKNAAASGVFVAASAGNGNRSGVSAAHTGPWISTVAAANHRDEDIGYGFSGPVPQVGDFSGQGPVDVAPEEQTILTPDIGAPGIDVLAAYANSPDGNSFGYLTGTSMSSPHISGLSLLLQQQYPEWSPMAIKSAMQTSAGDYTEEVVAGFADGNDPFVGGSGFVDPPAFWNPGLVFDSDVAGWDAFLADPTTGTELNQASVQIPALTGGTATTVTRTVTNVSDTPLTYTASVEGPDTLSVVVTPAAATIPAGGSAEVTIAVANTGAPTDEWQKSWVTWTTDGDASDVRIPVIARGEVGEGEPDPMVERVFGPTRYETAGEIARLYPDGVSTVYVTTGENYYDALAGGPAASNNVVARTAETPDGEPAPVLLVKQNEIPDITTTVLAEIDPDTVIILGGPVAVSEDVEAELEADYPGVQRIGGATRYDTAAQLAEQFGQTDRIYVATGEDGEGFADALAGSALAGSQGVPVLLTEKDEVPQAVLDAYEILQPTEVIVLGGPNAITDETYAALGGTERIAGTNRYETSALIVAEFGYDAETGNDAPIAHVATGENFPDALTGAALAGFQDAPVVLTRNTTSVDQENPVPAGVINALDSVSPDLVFILGGPVAVSQEAEDQLNEEYPAWAE